MEFPETARSKLFSDDSSLVWMSVDLFERGAESMCIMDEFVSDCSIDNELGNFDVFELACDGDDCDPFAVLLLDGILYAPPLDEGFDTGVLVCPFDGTELPGGVPSEFDEDEILPGDIREVIFPDVVHPF